VLSWVGRGEEEFQSRVEKKSNYMLPKHGKMPDLRIFHMHKRILLANTTLCQARVRKYVVTWGRGPFHSMGSLCTRSQTHALGQYDTIDGKKRQKEKRHAKDARLNLGLLGNTVEI
jgi:hypothetical protein